jgi:hypothetical protein
MEPATPGFVVAWDVVPFDVVWVLVPGLTLLALGGVLLLVPGSARRASRRLSGLAMALVLLSVWWTFGGIGAWRMGIGRLREGTADFVEGPVQAGAPGPDGVLLGFDVQGQRFGRARDAWVPALHATRWPTLSLVEGQRVRVWFFGGDVLRLELALGREGVPSK